MEENVEFEAIEKMEELKKKKNNEGRMSPYKG